MATRDAMRFPTNHPNRTHSLLDPVDVATVGDYTITRGTGFTHEWDGGDRGCFATFYVLHENGGVGRGFRTKKAAVLYAEQAMAARAQRAAATHDAKEITVSEQQTTPAADAAIDARITRWFAESTESSLQDGFDKVLAGLKRMVEEVERARRGESVIWKEGEATGRELATGTSRAYDASHAILWGLANLGVDDLGRLGAQADVARQRLEGAAS